MKSYLSPILGWSWNIFLNLLINDACFDSYSLIQMSVCYYHHGQESEISLISLKSFPSNFGASFLMMISN